MGLTRRERLSLRLWTPIFLVCGLLAINSLKDARWIPSLVLNKPLFIIISIIGVVSAVIALIDSPSGGDPLI